MVNGLLIFKADHEERGEESAMTSKRKHEKNLNLGDVVCCLSNESFTLQMSSSFTAFDCSWSCSSLQRASLTVTWQYSTSCRFWLVALLTVALQSGLRTRRCSPKYGTWNMYDCRTRFSLEKQLNEDNYKTKSLRNGGGSAKMSH